MIIKPSSALRNNYSGISSIAKQTQEPVYITVNGQSFQAFLCCEQELLELESHQANGFSCYLPAALAAYYI